MKPAIEVHTMNTFYLLRHAKVNVNPRKPANEWTLSSEGISETRRLVEERMLTDADFVYSSEEEKAYHTAKIIANSIGKEVAELSNFNELNRKSFLENYEFAVEKAFSNTDGSRNNWESCINALKRFRKGIELIDQKHENKRILIVSHGIVLTLYFAHLKGDMNNLFSRWKRLRFLSYGVVENAAVVKDIVH